MEVMTKYMCLLLGVLGMAFQSALAWECLTSPPGTVVTATSQGAYLYWGGEAEPTASVLGTTPKKCIAVSSMPDTTNDVSFEFTTFEMASGDSLEVIDPRRRTNIHPTFYATTDTTGQSFTLLGPAEFVYTYNGRATVEDGLVLKFTTVPKDPNATPLDQPPPPPTSGTPPGPAPSSTPDGTVDGPGGIVSDGSSSDDDDDGDDKDSKGLNIWAVLGPVLGVLVIVVIMVAVFLVYMQRQQAKHGIKREPSGNLHSHSSATRITVENGAVPMSTQSQPPNLHHQSDYSSYPRQYGSTGGIAVAPVPTPSKDNQHHGHHRRPSNQTLTDTVGSLFGGTPLPNTTSANTALGVGAVAAGGAGSAVSSRTSVGSALPPSSLQSIDIPASDVAIREEIGRGSFGSVYAGTYCGTDVAVKTVPVSDDSTRAAFERETAIMASVRHPNCVMMMGLISVMPDKPNFAGLVMEKAMCTIHDVLMSRKLDHYSATELALGIAKGIAYLHGRRIVHRDLKSQNVLLNSQGVPKVSDFGLSKIAEASAMSTSVGTPYTMAPEVIKHEPYDSSADVYSFAIVLWQLFTSQLPYRDLNAAQVVFQVAVAGVRPEIPDDVPPEIASIIRSGWDPDPTQRPTMESIIQTLSSFKDTIPQEQIPAPGSVQPSVVASAGAGASGNHLASILLSGVNHSTAPGSASHTSSSLSKGPVVSAQNADLNPDDSSTW